MQLRQIFTSVFVSSLVLLFTFFSAGAPIWSRSLEEINRDIIQKQEQLSGVESELEEAQAQLAERQSAQNTAQTEVDKIQAEINAIDAQIKVNKLESERLADQLALKELEKEDLERMQDLQVKSAYQSWKTNTAQNSLFGGPDIIRNSIYNEAVNVKGYGGIEELASELAQIEEDYRDYQTQTGDLQTQLEELDDKRQEAATRLAAARASASGAAGNVAGLRTQASSLQSQIEQLEEQQRQAQQEENSVLDQNPGAGANGGTQPVQSGEIYFSGTGRDRFQGHGVGMSQYGALGAALAGWDYKRIIEFYFPGTEVKRTANPPTINVNGNNQVPTERYVAGLGEVPNTSCESLGRAFDPNNFWSCWPEEAIKAQVVVARTYGVRRAGFVWGDPRGQVYAGHTGKQWAADATNGETVNYGGNYADVYYSSDNNQGRGTANNDTIWSSYEGNGTLQPYLRSVNDNAFAYRSDWTAWGWRTNSYSISELDLMLQWTSDRSYSFSGFVRGVKNNIGSLQSISYERDPSQRVKRVIFRGSNGEARMAGWLFKSVWNVYVGNAKPSGEADYIYSLTFFENRG